MVFLFVKLEPDCGGMPSKNKLGIGVPAMLPLVVTLVNVPLKLNEILFQQKNIFTGNRNTKGQVLGD